MDTMCKYKPWIQRVDAEESEKHKYFLSVFHAKGHDSKCEVSMK